MVLLNSSVHQADAYLTLSTVTPKTTVVIIQMKQVV